MTREKINVLIVDDSAVVRKALTAILESDPEIEVMATASDPFIAARKIQQQVPDVITLDVEMPRMDGITFLKRIMAQHPIPVVIISGLTAQGTETALEALALGAVDVITKPTFDQHACNEGGHPIIDIVKAASRAVLARKREPVSRNVLVRLSPRPSDTIKISQKIIAIGASTGGTDALLQFLQAMPVVCPGIVVAQHMPEGFTRSFAERLNRMCHITVKEASHGDSILQGHALIAPGNKHLEVKKDARGYYVELKNSDPVNRHRPSVDVLFSSVAKSAGANATGVIMTGMGADGANGLLQMKNAGAFTIAQNEATSVVFGMPKEAIKLNAAKKILPLPQIAAAVLAWHTSRTAC